ncbi:hypothetical protein BX600DRAFT_110761 [Xylariales sp. PMI_506]|nr:hypothetical protein BX600DRAFT_110761 [Xylariales sp. PMI_506]
MLFSDAPSGRYRTIGEDAAAVAANISKHRNEPPPLSKPLEGPQHRNKLHPLSESYKLREYFVPGDGIDIDVITSSIGRYLGNDARVNPGKNESPETGKVVDGYYIYADRDLSPSMIRELKLDSALEAIRKRRTVTIDYDLAQILSETSQTIPPHATLTKEESLTTDYWNTRLSDSGYGARTLTIPKVAGGGSRRTNEQDRDIQSMDEIATQYSDAPNISQNQANAYISNLGADLSNNLKTYQWTPRRSNRW